MWPPKRLTGAALQIVERNVERDPTMKTGPGLTRKGKIVVRNELDFRVK